MSWFLGRQKSGRREQSPDSVNWLFATIPTYISIVQQVDGFLRDLKLREWSPNISQIFATESNDLLGPRLVIAPNTETHPPANDAIRTRLGRQLVVATLAIVAATAQSRSPPPFVSLCH